MLTVLTVTHGHLLADVSEVWLLKDINIILSPNQYSWNQQRLLFQTCKWTFLFLIIFSWQLKTIAQ